MVQINFAQKTVTVKIVYYGPGMSGKTTNLEVVHQRAPDSNRGDLTSIATDGDRTLFFDFMPLDLGTVAGMRTQFQIYTVPGQVYYNSTRKLVLQGVDGVIFVADSSASMLEENLESLRNLEENLVEYGKALETVPHVIQYNKRDLPDAMTVEDLEASLNRVGAPSFEGIASSGQGVFPTLKALAAKVLDSIHSQQDGGGGGAQAPEAPPVAPPVQAATGFYPAAAVPPAPAAPAAMPTPPPMPAAPAPAASMPQAPGAFPVPDASTGFYPGGQVPVHPQAAPQPPTPMPPQPAPPGAMPAGPQGGWDPAQAQAAGPGAPVQPPMPQGTPGMPGMPGVPGGAPGMMPQDMSQMAPPAQMAPAQAPPAESGLRMAPPVQAQPAPQAGHAAAGPIPIRPAVPMTAGPSPSAMMQPPTPGAAPPMAAPGQLAPQPGASRLKPRSTALPTPKNSNRSRSAARTALFVTLALAAGVVLGSLVISVL